MTRRSPLFMVVMCVLAWPVYGAATGAPAASVSPPQGTRELSQEVKADGVVARARISQNAISTSDRLRLVIELEVLSTLEPVPIDLTAQLGVDWESKRVNSPLPVLTSAGTMRHRAEFDLEPLVPGELEIPAITVAVAPKGGDEKSRRTVTFKPFVCRVQSVLPADSTDPQLAAAKGIVDPGTDWRRWIIGGAGALAVIGAGAALLWLAARRRRERRAEALRRAAHDVALERLERLLSSGLLGRAAYNEFYAGLSGILRQYLEDRFGLHAPDRTTEEFLDEMRASAVRGETALSADDAAVLERFLSQCDLVKFARAVPEAREADAAVGTVREIIERTKSAEHQIEIVTEPESVPTVAGAPA